MELKTVFIKEVITPTGKQVTAYSTLTGALKSETLYHMYASARYIIKGTNRFQYEAITISKVSLISQKYGKR